MGKIKLFFFVAPIIAFVCLIFSGYEVLIDDNLEGLLFWTSIPISILLDVFILTQVLDEQSYFMDNLRRHTKWPRLQIVGFLLLAPFTVYIMLCYSIPTALHILLPKHKTSIVVTVDYKADSYYGSGKRPKKGEVILEEYTYFLNNSIHGLQKKHWDMLDYGSKIKLFGSRSRIGFKFEKYGIVKKQ